MSKPASTCLRLASRGCSLCCSFVKRLMGGEWFWPRVGRAQQLLDAPCEVALERPDRFAVGLAFGLLARDEVDRFGVTAGARDGDAVDGGVDQPCRPVCGACTVVTAHSVRLGRQARAAVRRRAIE